MRQKNLFKSTKMFKISQTCFAARPRVRINYSPKKRKREFFPTSFAVILSAVALPIMLKAEFNFDLILYITIFAFQSPGSCFKSVICIQNSLESAPIILFSPQLKEGKIIHLKGLNAPFTLIFHSEAT